MYEIVRIFADVIRVATFQPAPEPVRDRFAPRRPQTCRTKWFRFLA